MSDRRALAAALGRVLDEPGLAAEHVSPISGGCIDTTLVVDTGRRRVFVKLSPRRERLEAEADGLVALAACTALRVPRVFGIETMAVDGRSLLALEYLPLQADGDEHALGAAIAELHAITGPRFGWPRDNFIGATLQINGWSEDWAEFVATRRLRPQLRLAAHAAADLGELAEPVLAALPRLFAAHPPTPALLHGDLWRGNVGFVGGQPAIFDPAVHYGDGEADLAMSELFGGFGPGFYAAYRQHHAEAPGPVRRRRRRRD